jgi:hypothetical protein
MKLLVRARVGTIFALSLLFVVGTSTLAQAGIIVLSNDVGISWSQVGPEACPILGLCPDPVTVLGLPRLVPNARAMGDQVFFDVDIVSNAFASFNLFLNVGDTSLNEVLYNGNPLRLTYSTSPSLTMDQFFNTYPGGVLKLQDFENFNLLPLGTDLIFTLDGTFQGKSVFCDHCAYGATITATGAGTELRPVPEPGTLILLLSGLTSGGVSAWRRRVSQNALRQSPD